MSLDDASLFASKCFLDRTEIVIQDYDGRGNQSPGLQVTKAGDGQPKSLLYIPLVYKEKPVGVITAQSFETNAYGDYEISVLRNLATYTAIAIDNADAYRRLNASLEELKAMQEQLLVQEKLASLGQLTAGIAHEIKNPLNFVNNFAQLIGELADDLEEELQANSDKRVIEVQEDLQEILGHLKTNAEKINEHGQRADGIVRSMLQHSRSDSGERTETDINQLLEEYVNLAYHGAKATNTSFDPTIVRDYDPASGSLLAIPQDIGRVFLNLLNNAFYAVQRRTEDDGDEYQATVYVSTTRRNGMVDIVIRDNGAGIPAAIQDRIFEPFFTTKPTGSGTGLGLSLSYDIVTNAHGGHLAMSSSEGMGAEFTISLPDSAG